MSDVAHRRPENPLARPIDAPSDADLARLLEQSARGNETAFAELYDATSGRCYGLAMRILGDAADAETVTCAAYLHAWTHSSRYDPADGSPFAWLAALVNADAVACLSTKPSL